MRQPRHCTESDRVVGDTDSGPAGARRQTEAYKALWVAAVCEDVPVNRRSNQKAQRTHP